MIKFKEIPLTPSLWTLDVIIGKDREEVMKFTMDRYDMKESEFVDAQLINTVSWLKSGKKSILKGEQRIVLTLGSLNERILVHELVHVLWYYGDRTGSEITVDTQEWQAIFFEWLYVECLKKETYKSIKKNK